jgi:hypothetical protein
MLMLFDMAEQQKTGKKFDALVKSTSMPRRGIQ